MSNERTIATQEDLDEFLETMNTPFVVAIDPHSRPWLVYLTEDEPYAASFPVEADDGVQRDVTVGDMIMHVDSLDLPLTVVYDPEGLA